MAKARDDGTPYLGGHCRAFTGTVSREFRSEPSLAVFAMQPMNGELKPNGELTLRWGEQAFVSAASPVMRAVERTIQDIADTDIPVLVMGESGTGKNAVAVRLHQLSRHKNRPLLKVNCAALTAEFFNGTGIKDASPSQPWADAGTVLLDEVGELDTQCQRKLLYAFPEGNGAAPERPDARIISVTRSDLEREIRAGRFREELYYRLSGVCLNLPALRERREDIPVLADFFLAKYAALFGRPKPEISQSGMRVLLDYWWPGNIRELEYAIQKLIALGKEAVVLAQLRDTKRSKVFDPVASVSLKQAARAASREAERELILKVLSRTHWNRKRAAQELQISYKALLYKLKQIGLDTAGT